MLSLIYVVYFFLSLLRGPGCMNSVEVNGRLVDLSRIPKQNKIVPGCGGGQQHDEAPSPSRTAPTAPPLKHAAHTDIHTLTRSSTLDTEEVSSVEGMLEQ